VRFEGGEEGGRNTSVRLAGGLRLENGSFFGSGVYHPSAHTLEGHQRSLHHHLSLRTSHCKLTQVGPTRAAAGPAKIDDWDSVVSWCSVVSL
jgi:hypothetical protein